ncbi:DUF2291 domain-containing protein [Sphingomonas sp. ZT3P38]|uniref:DUF2291 family protein n=1 Tax=Parasphingomonas zepuensis TaxID=3096161 RepID=UPI002FCB9B9E
MGRSAYRRGKTAAALSAFLAGACLLGGCKVLTIEEDRALRARRGADFDAASYVKDIWAPRVLPTIVQTAVPIGALLPAVDAGLGRAGTRLGRQVGDGSAWTFVVKGVGQVRSIDTATRQGGIDLTLDGASGDRTVRLQVGPVVSGSAIRDALPFVAFDDFSDQLAFADLGTALTNRALAAIRPQLSRLRPGQHIRFVGVVNLRDAGDPLVVTPVEIGAGDND